MRWAIEIRNTSLERRNLADLLQGLGFELVDGVDYEAAYSPQFDFLETAAEVWEEGKKLREAFAGPASIDPGFQLGSVIDCSSEERRRHVFLEADSLRLKVSVGSPTLTVSPPPSLSEESRIEWEKSRAEQDYQAKLERQREKLEPAYLNPKAQDVLKALNKENHTGESLYKIYELMEGHPSNRKDFQNRFGISVYEFRRFGDAVHNPAVSGDLARHAYKDKTRTENPMTFEEAKAFIQTLAKKWLALVRENRT